MIRELLKRFEGERLTAYQDTADIFTIGVGHTKGVKKDDKITREQLEKFLDADMVTARIRVLRCVPDGLSIQPYEFDALLSLAFNLRSFEKLAKYLETSKELFKTKMLLYCKDIKGNYLPGLLKRRICERLLFENRDWESIADKMEGMPIAKILDLQNELFES
jgi:lysozyme